MLRCERQQEAVPAAQKRELRAKLSHENRCLGHPSFGGRLTAVQFETKRERRATLVCMSSRSAIHEMPVTAKLVLSEYAQVSVRWHARGPCCSRKLLCSCRTRPCGVPQCRDRRPCHRQRIRPRNVVSPRPGCQNAPCSERRHLTPPSSGRSKGRFAPFGPPLMSNVRPHMWQFN